VTRPDPAAARPVGQGRAARIVAAAEHAVKAPIWGCQMCGQCVLHSTGMTCPMTCPKTLRNGPCGGVRANGHCEVKPEMRCVWLNAYERSERLPLWRGHIDDLRPPVDNSLKGTSSWINLITGRDRQTPAGWSADADVEP
jgi:methylene-tetrahydrofolate reductase-like protein